MPVELVWSNRPVPTMLKKISHVPEGGNWRDISFQLLPAGMLRAEPQDHTKRYGRLSRKYYVGTLDL